MTYEKIVKNLKLWERFLEGSENAGNRESIGKRLNSAGEDILLKGKTAKGEEKKKGIDYLYRPDIFAVNQCLHLASSVVLLGSNHQDLQETLKSVHEKGYEDKDPTTIVTVATLYYLIKVALGDPSSFCGKVNVNKFSEKLKVIHRRFDEIQWLVGSGAISKSKLNITPLK